MIELKVIEYKVVFETDGFNKIINPKRLSRKDKHVKKIGEIIEVKNNKNKDIKLYKLNAINKKHLIGCIMKSLGETNPFDLYKDNDIAKKVIEAVNNSNVTVDDMIVHCQTRDYSNNRPNNTSSLIPFESADERLKRVYSSVSDRTCWVNFLLALNDENNIIEITLDDIKNLNESNLKDFLRKNLKVNKVFEGRLLELSKVASDVTRRGFIINEGSIIPQVIASKLIKTKGGKIKNNKFSLECRLGTLRSIMYNIEFSFKVNLSLDRELEKKLHNEITFCANESVCEIKRTLNNQGGIKIDDLFIYTTNNKTLNKVSFNKEDLL